MPFYQRHGERGALCRLTVNRRRSGGFDHNRLMSFLVVSARWLTLVRPGNCTQRIAYGWVTSFNPVCIRTAFAARRATHEAAIV
jgi:hypothetical protein